MTEYLFTEKVSSEWMQIFAVIESLQNIPNFIVDVEKVKEIGWFKIEQNTGFYKNYVPYIHIYPHTNVSQQDYELEYVHKKW